MSDANPTFDTPPDEDVLQYEETVPDVPVEVRNAVRIDEMPTTNAYKTLVINNDTGIEKILNADPRRKRAIMWVTSVAAGGGVGLFFGSQTDIQGGRGGGAFLQANSVAVPTSTDPGMRVEITDRGEVWARPGHFTESGNHWTGWEVGAGDVIVSLIIEQWAR